MSELSDSPDGRTRAAIALGALWLAGLAEGRFRVLQAEALARVEPESALDVSGGIDAVAAWHVAGAMVEPWLRALIFGGLTAALALGVLRQSTARRACWTLASATLAYFSLTGLGPDARELELFARTDASFSGWLQPAPVAGLAAGASALLFFVLAPLTARAARSPWSWIGVGLAAALALVHSASLFTRGAAPVHATAQTDRWLVASGTEVKAWGGDLTLEALGSVRLEPEAMVAWDDAGVTDFDTWLVFEDGVATAARSSRIGAEVTPLRLVDARRATRDARPSRRSTDDAPSLITIAIDGLRAKGLDDWLRSRTAPDAIQRCAESGVFFPAAITPTSDPRANEAAILSGEHPALRGRAPVAQHLGEVLGAAGLVSQLLAEGAPRPGVAGGFARVEHGLGDEAILAARRFVAAHAEERFHLHLSLERLSLEADWAAEPRPGVPRRPAEDTTLIELRDTARQRVAERSRQAERNADLPPLDVSWRAWFDAVHRARTRELLEELDELFLDLELLGLDDRCVVLLCGTSGVALGEHDSLGFAQDLHAESVRVPLLVRGPGLPVGERRDGVRDLTLVAAALSRRMHIPWPGPEAAWDWTARDADALPIFMQQENGVWNGVPGREILGLVEDGHVVHWCPESEGDTRLMPGYGPWRMYRLEADPTERTDLSLIVEFEDTVGELRAGLRVRAERYARDRAAAESVLEPWAKHGAWKPEVQPW